MKTMPLLLIVLSWTIVGHTKEPDMRQFSKEADKTAQELREKIRKEIKTLGKHPWAGEYFEGGPLGGSVHMSLAPKAGYCYESDGCMLYERNFGGVEEKDGKLRLSFTFEHQPEDPMALADELIPTAWGERVYLVPTREFIAFCNLINEGSEPRKMNYGFALLRVGDEKKNVTGFPALPKAFEPYLLSKPIETEIVSVGKPATTPIYSDGTKVTIRVRLKHGKKSGLLPGMDLYVIKPESVDDYIRVEKVEGEQSEGVITRIDFKDSTFPPLREQDPKIGWKISTRRPL